MTTIIRYTALLFITIILSSCYSDEPESPAKMPLVIEGCVLRAVAEFSDVHSRSQAYVLLPVESLDVVAGIACFNGFALFFR